MKGQRLDLTTMAAVETFSKPPARYSEASLVKKLEELGVGRPSTYAPTISTIQAREYVERKDVDGTSRSIQALTLSDGTIQETTTTETMGADRSKLLPTHIAEVTIDFLVKYFPSIVDYAFTATVENDFDRIAEGGQQWDTMIAEFYKSFHPLVAAAGDASRQEVSQAKVLGVDPKTRKPVMARFGRYGPMLQRGEAEDDDKPTFAPLPAGTTLDTVTLEQALEMFELPRVVGKTADGQEIKANIGRFGPYIQVGKTFVSIKPHDPFDITEAEARELYAGKLEKEANKYIKEYASGIKIVNGPYGAYVTNGKKNAKITGSTSPADLSEEQCKKLLDAAPQRKRFTRRRKKN
jgi:DNA topoisomerase-1